MRDKPTFCCAKKKRVLHKGTEDALNLSISKQEKKRKGLTLLRAKLFRSASAKFNHGPSSPAIFCWTALSFRLSSVLMWTYRRLHSGQ